MNFKTLSALLYVLLIAWHTEGCSGKNRIKTPATIDKNVATDIVYGSNTDWKGNTQSLKLDIYSPAKMEKDKKYPLVLFIHGGGYLGGDKKSADEKCSILVDSGFIAVSINYRLGWDKGKEQCNANLLELENAGYRAVQDANAALRFLVSNADNYSIDTNWIFVSGSSAGAVTAVCAAYLDDDNVKTYYPEASNALGSLTKSGNTLTSSYTIKGISSISGGLPDTNLIRSGKAIPAILFHGARDETVPVEYGHYYSCDNYPYLAGSLPIYRTLSRYNSPAIAHILSNAGHGTDGENSGYSDKLKMMNTASFFHSLIEKEKIQTGIFYEGPTSDISLLHKLFHKKPSST